MKLILVMIRMYFCYLTRIQRNIKIQQNIQVTKIFSRSKIGYHDVLFFEKSFLWLIMNIGIVHPNKAGRW